MTRQRDIVGEIERASNVQEDLRRKYRPFIDAFEWTRMPMVITNPRLPDNPIVFVNPAFLRLTGYPIHEVIGHNCRFLQGPETSAEAVAQLRNAIADAREIAIDLLNHKKDGQVFWNELFLTPIFDEDGTPEYFFASQTDVTRYRAADRAEAAREIADERLRIAQEAGEIGTFEWFPESGRLHVSETYRKIWGLTPKQELTTDFLMNRVHPDDRHKTGGNKLRVSENPLEYAEYRISRADTGEERWLARKGEAMHLSKDSSRRFVGVTFDITDRKRFETRIKESEARFRGVFDSKLMGFAIFDANISRVVAVNDHFLSLTGHTREDFDSGNWDWRSITPEEHLPKDEDAISQAKARGWWDKYEKEYFKRDGSRLPVRIASAILPGEPGCVVVSIQDISEERASAAALLASEARYRTLTETLPQLVWTCLPNGLCDYLSKQWVSFTGFSEEEQKGFRWLDLVVHPEDRSRVVDHWLGAVEGQHPYDIEYRIRRNDGVYRWFKSRGTPIRNSEGDTVYWFGTCTDIEDIVTARELQAQLRAGLEQQVTERTRERDQIFVLSHDLFTVAGFDGYLKIVNPAWMRLLKYTEETLLSRPLQEFVHPDDRTSTEREMESLRRGEPTSYFESRLLGEDGEVLWISWTAVPEQQSGLIYAVGKNITLEKERQAELDSAQEALRQSQKMEAVGQLTGGIAHDFNNLLQVVIGNLEILQRNLPDTGRSRRSAQNAMTGAKRAATLTQRLLAFSRRQPLAPKSLDINRLVADMSDLLLRTLGETIEIETVLAGGIWQVEADPNQLENVLLNLALNARDAMAGGGKLTIETGNAHLDDAYHSKNLEARAGQYVAISISDTGSGMDKETLERAFEPFFTTKEVGKGTGLGLSMVYGFVKQSGGHVKIYSEAGEGTTVKIYLPRQMMITAEVEKPIIPLAPEGSVSETILVVEDDDDVREYTVEVLKGLGYAVLEARDSPTALQLLEDEALTIELLFTDIVLPGGLTGAEIARKAARLRPEMKVLFTTGYARNAIVHQGRLDAGVQLLPKPFTSSDLSAKLREILDC